MEERRTAELLMLNELFRTNVIDKPWYDLAVKEIMQNAASTPEAA